jgi:hypothetical protein
LRLIRELVDFKPEHRQTDVDQALRFLTNVAKKRCTAFVLSDFISKVLEGILSDFDKYSVRFLIVNPLYSLIPLK